MKYIVRKRNSNKDIIYKSNTALNILYNTFVGRILLRLIITKPITNLIGLYMSCKYSKVKVKKFVKKNEIKLSDYSKKKYACYNDFFTREIVLSKRPISANKEYFIAPCDSKLSVYNIDKSLALFIKGAYYSIDTLIEKNILNDYIDGYALVFRLTTDDYHRYCYIDSGSNGKNYHINGVYHTVQPISLMHYNFYKTNNREYTILNTDNFGPVVFVEVGAMGIGKIKNHHEEYKFKKGEEKGYFEFGGSTIVLLVKEGILKIDDDIMNNSEHGIETIVKYGEKIARKNI